VNGLSPSGQYGSGKSDHHLFAQRELGWTPYYEVVDENPYLPDFYGDMSRWSFHLQVFFLSKRFQHTNRLCSRGSIFQDRTIYEDAEIFARNLYLHGQMDERDFRTTTNSYDDAAVLAPPTHPLP